MKRAVKERVQGRGGEAELLRAYRKTDRGGNERNLAFHESIERSFNS